MNDLWNFSLGLGDGMQNALVAAHMLPILIIGVLIGLFQPKAEHLGTKALITLAIAILVPALWPTLDGRQPVWPDIRHLATIVQIFMMYVVAYGIIGVVGALKSGFKPKAAKPAH
jgi:RsiW-degrading membrane proteinase PrsW (M82 family)